jgi:L-alanine-DL-glutamate epimerase-like enolase superfamily enzyme
VLVKITCEDGTVGWGQSVPLPTWSYETPESVISTIRLYLAPALLGKNPCDLEAIHMAMRKAIASSFSTGTPIAKAGLDLALHDVMGKLTNRRLSDLWGRTSLERVQLSWTVNARSLKEAEELMDVGKSRGFQHFNVKVAPDPKFDLELCKYVRSQAPQSFLWNFPHIYCWITF